jgi:hypothetical protein
MCADCDVDGLVAAAPAGWRVLPLGISHEGVIGT